MDDEFNDNEDFEEQRAEFGELAVKVTEAVEPIGLYPSRMPPSVVAPPGSDPVLRMQFSIGDVAYLPRVQNPEQFDLDTQFQVAMPSETEMEAIRIRAMMEERGDV